MEPKIKKRKIYIAGKVTGLPPVDVFNKFKTYQSQLQDQHKDSVEIYNPIELARDSASWEEAMRICIMNLIHCDEIHLLPCWAESKGARLELEVARGFGLEVKYLEKQWSITYEYVYR